MYCTLYCLAGRPWFFGPSFCMVAATLVSAVHSTTPPVGYYTWPTYVFTVQCVLRSSLLLTSNLFRLGWLLPHTRSIFGIFKVFLCLVVWPHPPWFCTPRLGCGRVALQYWCSPDSLTFCIGYTCWLMPHALLMLLLPWGWWYEMVVLYYLSEQYITM